MTETEALRAALVSARAEIEAKDRLIQDIRIAANGYLERARAAEAVKSAGSSIVPAEDDTEPKTALEIVEEVNEVAKLLAGHRGYEPEHEGFKFYDTKNRISQQCWEVATEVYELITGTEVHDALQEVLGE